MTLTFGSLFAGIGGIDLGLERAGMRCAWQVEIDDYARRVLAKHWPDVPRFCDVRECGAHNLPAVDVLAGGFPCQPHSTAGRRRGANDDRDLWPEYLRLIREIRPRWVMAENVPGLLSTDDGRFFGAVLRGLAESGYDAEWDCIPAGALGAPHWRDRVFIVAHVHSTGQGRIQPIEGVFSHTPELADDGKEKPLADANTSRWNGWVGEQRTTGGVEPANGCKDVAYSDRQGLAVGEILGGNARAQLTAFERGCSTGSGQWAVEPNVGRVVDGVPHRMDRLRGLGNAVVPQVAQFVGRLIVAHSEALTVVGAAGA